MASATSSHGASRLAPPACRASRRGALKVKAELTSKGRAILPSSIKVDRIMGEGSFGQVFQGVHKTAGGEEKVVLKRVKAKVEGAENMAQMELLLNAYASKTARNHCAEFVGYCEVAEDEATARLTPGLWLMWKFEGSRTLSYYLRRRDTLRALASDLEVPEEAVVATVMKQLLEGLAAFHAAGLVHRDVKPLNVIFAEQRKRFKLIDLGACADLRTGTNYTPDESILDPNYCPPEQYVLPTDSPHLAKSFLKLAISPVLWAQHKPDRFDMWSAGITLLQLAVPAMRQDRVLKRFNQDFGQKYDYDLDAWRAGSYISARDFEALDADNGAGWELAKALLRPRSIRVLDDNSVVFVNERNSAQRVSAGEALRHRFLKQAREPGSIMEEDYASSTSGGGGSSNGRGSAGQRRSSQQLALQGGAGRTSGGSGGNGASASSSSSSGGKRQRRSGGGGGSVEEQRAAGGAKAGTFGAAVGLWRNLTNKLFDLEANIMVQASATEKQSTIVQKLQKKAAQGQVPREAVQQEVRKLGAMEQQLSQLQDDFNATASAVGNVLGFLGFGSSKPAAPPAAPPSPPPAPAGRRPGDRQRAPQPEREREPSVGASGSARGGFFGGLPFSSPPSSPRGAAAAAAPPPAAPAAPSGPSGIWAAVQERLSELESKFNNQAAATERQSFTVKKLRQGVKAGQVDASTLQKAEAVLQRMERRVNELDTDLKRTRQEATGLLGLLASSVSQVTGGGNSGGTTGSTTSSTTSSAAAADAGSGKQKQSVGGAAAPAASAPAPAVAGGNGSVGGFFSRMFGGKPSSGSAAAAAAVAAPRQQPAAAAPPSGSGKQERPAAEAQQAQARQTPASYPVAGLDEASAGEGTASVQAITDGANSLIANSLKFTGMAAKVAFGMAAAMKADAEKLLREMEAEAEAKRARKLAEQAFLRMLATKVPPMGPGTTFAEVEEFFGQDARYLAVEAAQRPLLVASYVDALVQAQRRSAQQAQAKLRELLSLNLKLDSTWDEAAAQFGDDPAFLAVEDPAARRAVYDEVVAALRSAEDNRLAAGLAEQAFIDLLHEVTPPIAPDSTWTRVKPLLWRDYRYLALPEPRRRALFDEMHAVVCEQAKQAPPAPAANVTAPALQEVQPAPAVVEAVATAAPAATSPSTATQPPASGAAAAAVVATAAEPAAVAAAAALPPATPAPAVATAAEGQPAGAPVNPVLLEELRKQQARLRQEYEAMERKLREMEAALTTRQQANTPRLSTLQPPAAGTTPRPGRTTTISNAGAGGAANGGGNGNAPTPARAAATPALARLPPGAGASAAAAAAAAEVPAAGEAAAAAPSAGVVVAATPSSARVVTGSGMRRSIIATPPLVRADGAGAGASAGAGGVGQGRPEGVKLEQERAVADSLAAAGVSYKRLGDGTLVFTFDPEDGEAVPGGGGASAVGGGDVAPPQPGGEAAATAVVREPSRSRTPA